jgi:hypothetical protein
MTEERMYDGNWYKAVRTVLLITMEGTHRFWRQNMAQIVCEGPSGIFIAYEKMTAIYLSPNKKGRFAEAKKMIPRVNKITMFFYKGIMIHTKNLRIYLWQVCNHLLLLFLY